MSITGSLPDRIFDKVDASGDCWEWTAAKAAGGYGYVWWQSSMRPAHRVVYEALVGPIGELHIDHLCRNISCVNPDHLEPVTPQQNASRGATGRYKRPDVCRRGHDRTNPDNIYAWKGIRQCRACRQLHSIKGNDKRRGRRREATRVLH